MTTTAEPEQAAPPPPSSALPSGLLRQREIRLGKLARLRERQALPYRFDHDSRISEVRQRHTSLGPGARTDAHVSVAGRVSAIRRHGGVVFVDVREAGDQIQLVAEPGQLDEVSTAVLHQLDRGDLVGVAGTVITTARGELSIAVDSMQLLNKCLRPLPDSHRGMTDPEARVRMRYVDLIANEKSRRTYEIRFKAVKGVRDELARRGFHEVETPNLNMEIGGAHARPFVTHHNALNTDMYLRIAPELYLKRLLVGGFDRVFEMGRAFRNEGIDFKHNPEFTIIEMYQAYGDYTDMMELAQAVTVSAAMSALGTTVVHIGGREVDLAKPWRRVTMVDIVAEVTGERIDLAGPVEDARAALDRLGIEYEDHWGTGKLLAEIYDERCEDPIIEPTFITDYPVEISPLARGHRHNPLLTERFEIVVNKAELGNAYSEQNDPIVQRQAFEAEDAARLAGDVEAGTIDEDFLRALEFGMPPAGGLGIGIDRLVMILAEAANIRDVILFPTLRPESSEQVERQGMATPEPVLPTASVPVRARPGEAVRSARSSGPARWLSIAMAVLGGLAIAAAIASLFIRGLHVTGVAPIVVGAICLFLVSGGLRRRTRIAWWATLGLTGLLAALLLLNGFWIAGAIFAAVFVAVLACTGSFPRGERLRHGRRWVVGGLAYLVVLWIISGIILAVEEENLDSASDWIGAILLGPLGASRDVADNLSKGFTKWFEPLIVALLLAGVAVLLWRLLLPRSSQTASADERERARGIVERWGWDTLAPFALRPDRRYVFGSDGESLIAYGIAGRFALAAGDPIGPPDSISVVLDDFLAHCAARNLTPAFLAAREVDAPLYQARGLRTFYLGDEAILDLRRFSVEKLPAVRQAHRRVAKGHSFELIPEPAASPQLRDALNAISEHWRKGTDERGYTMAFGDDVDGTHAGFLLAVATDEAGKPIGFLRLAPTGDPQGSYGLGYTLDLMRRDPDAPNGTTEFLIVSAAQALAAKGVRRLSLNFSTFGRLFDRDVEARLSFTDRALANVVRRFNSQFQLESLRTFNERFNTEWLPRSLVYRERGDLAKVGFRFAQLEGFVDVPGFRAPREPSSQG